MHAMNLLKMKIAQWAQECGFSRLGIATLQENSEGFHLFHKWIQKGLHGEMSYLERGLEKRRNPSLILENAQSVLVFAVDYRQGISPDENHRSHFISRYAWGNDYHSLIQSKLESLKKKLVSEFPSEHFLSYVDTGPIQEKYWAALAGLGWMGKHTNLIHLKDGSYFFLAVLLTSLKIEPDTILSNHCGKCQACIDICPTQAIIAPYLLDARLCISYLTIEFKGVIPLSLRKKIGTHVFGCDDCQEVCPWNKHARLPESFLKNTSVDELHDYLALTSAEFKKRFFNTSILRSKRRGFLRNVCVVLGNIQDPSSIPHLDKALNDEEALVRGHAAWALGQFELSSVKEILYKRLEFEEEQWVREEIEKSFEDRSLL
ncbi:MAG: tRNA epoxyqueuosine(34) reductase QueG [Deltaproteobacteria bacterium]|nr:tRNA epoxyqueuosine(34) reductase QueG [Deltaproteobacteria bacterium]